MSTVGSAMSSYVELEASATMLYHEYEPQKRSLDFHALLPKRQQFHFKDSCISHGGNEISTVTSSSVESVIHESMFQVKKLNFTSVLEFYLEL